MQCGRYDTDKNVIRQIKKQNYFGFSKGSGSLRARPTGLFSASSAVTRWNSASTFPYGKNSFDTNLYSIFLLRFVETTDNNQYQT